MPAEPSPPSDERKVATVLFADLVGSTAQASEEDPERVRVLLERFYTAMAAEIEAAGGTIEKFAGDAVMAAFGAPAAQEDHAERALHAALAMQHRLGELFGDTLSARIGVNTGEVVVGAPRAGGSFVSGDAVNVAARLEQAAEPGEVLVGARTASAVRGAFEFGAPAVLEAKGKREGIDARRLLRALSLMRPRGLPGLGSSFVGREAELARLTGAYEAAVTEGRPQLVTILGDPGLGKTRIVREFWQQLDEASPQPLRRTGRCLSYGQGTAYWALAEVLREHLGILESDSTETALSRLGERRILGLTLGLDVGAGIHPLSARDQLYSAWVEFLEELARDQPLVLLVEDIHWAEEPLLDLLERIVDDARGPLLVLTTARPELVDARPGWGARRRYADTIPLEPLPPETAGLMLSDLLAKTLPAELAATVVARAEGNPFFVEELVATLMDRGVIERANGSWRAHDIPAGFEIPDSVRSVLAARIDLLGPAEKEALQAASVIGRIFWTGPLYELLGDVIPDLRVLEERDFIRRRSGSSLAGEQEYAIKHTLTSEVAYESLPRARRARLHAAFAAWLERVGESRDEWATLLAHHYAEAARPEDADLAWAGADDELEQLQEKAVHWLTRAGKLAVDRYEIDEALELFHRALRLAPSSETAASIWLAIGNATALRYDGAAFANAMERALELSDDPAIKAKTYSELAFQTGIRIGMWTTMPEVTTIDDWIERALALTEEKSHERARALIALANTHPDDGELARQASALADELGDPELRSWAWMARTGAAFEAGRFEESLTWAQRRFDLEGQITDPDHLVEMRENALPVAAALGRLREVRRLVEEHTERTRTLSPHHQMHSVALRAESFELEGNWEEIRSLQREIEQAVEANRDTPCVRNARSILLCAVARAEHGDESGARALESTAEEVGLEGHGYPLEAARIRLALMRRDMDGLAELIERDRSNRFIFNLQTFAARLDGIAALRDLARAERESTRFLQPGTYLEPFALRALGAARGDESLIARAQERFHALTLGWHAEQTRALVG
jgi:class 3 adenylate cyclase/tetratricopeptide (TPR) repeat protein